MSFLIGLLAGIFGGLVGLGGGIVMIPLMVGILKVGQHKAHGTSLVWSRSSLPGYPALSRTR